MTAVGIHAHDRYKLGAAKATKSRDQLLQIKFKTDQPSRSKVDNMSNVTPGMYDNDRIGDCGPTMLCNARRISSLALTGHQHNVLTRKCVQLYSEVSGYDPNTGANDNGVENDKLMAAARQYGVGDEKIAFYGQVQGTSDADLALAIDVFGFACVAVDLQTAQQTQTSRGFWDYQPSGEWGGHDIVFGAYDLDTGEFDNFSWAERIKTTSAFRSNQLGEIWVVGWPEILTSDKFNALVDTDALHSDFQSLTGNPLDLSAG